MDNSFVTVTGRVSRDPKFFGEGDKRRALFGVAFNRGFGDKRRTTFVDCVAWGRLADSVEKNLSKGTGLTLNGDLESFTVEKDGNKQDRISINIRTFTLTTTLKSSGNNDTDQNQEQDSEESVEIPF